MHMVAKAPAPAAAPAAAPAPAPAAAPAQGGVPATGANVNNQALPNPFAAMFGGMGGAPGAAPAMGGMGGMGMGMGIDPNMLAQMMNNPLIQQQLQQALANPQVRFS